MNAPAIILITLLAGILPIAIALLITRRAQAKLTLPPTAGDRPLATGYSKTALPHQVATFYNTTTPDFIKVYGDVIQAFRTRDLSNLLDYQIQAIGLQPGMTAIDAGCGIAGPATYFAKKADIHIHAVTISSVQADLARQKIADQQLRHRIQVYEGDYHQLHTFLPAECADVVYFLESFGHSHDKAAAIDSAWQVLKPGGRLYIKDLFLRESLHPSHTPIINREVQRINDAYHYNIADLYTVLAHIRKSGWILAHLKTIDLPLHDFENLSISNDFQELTGIGRIDSWADYIFPVEFYELICLKPWHQTGVGDNRYFLQNLYYKQIHHKTEAEIAAMRMSDK